MTIQTKLQAAEHDRNVFFVSVDAGTDVKTLVKPDYWAHVARQLHRGDHIEVLAIDGSFYAELVVVSVGGTWARVMLINHVAAGTQEKPVAKPDAHYIKWSSPSTKFRVHRTADKEVVADGFETQGLAKEWLDKYEKDNYKSAV